MATDETVCMIVFKYRRTCYLVLGYKNLELPSPQANFTFPLTQFSVNLNVLTC